MPRSIIGLTVLAKMKVDSAAIIMGSVSDFILVCDKCDVEHENDITPTRLVDGPAKETFVF